MTTIANATILTVRARAFSGERIRSHRVQIDGQTVRVWDSVAGHYTTCHALTASAVRRILRAARAA